MSQEWLSRCGELDDAGWESDSLMRGASREGDLAPGSFLLSTGGGRRPSSGSAPLTEGCPGVGEGSFGLWSTVVSIVCWSCLRLFETPWIAACQASLYFPVSQGFCPSSCPLSWWCRYWSGLPLPSPEDLPGPGGRTRVSCIAGGFFNNWATTEAHGALQMQKVNEDRGRRHVCCSLREVSEEVNERADSLLSTQYIQDKFSRCSAVFNSKNSFHQGTKASAEESH